MAPVDFKILVYKVKILTEIYLLNEFTLHLNTKERMYL